MDNKELEEKIINTDRWSNEGIKYRNIRLERRETELKKLGIIFEPIGAWYHKKGVISFYWEQVYDQTEEEWNDFMLWVNEVLEKEKVK